MSENDMKEVDFTCCLSCLHWTKDEAEEPCCECLSNPVNAYSHKPVRYEKNPDYKQKDGRS